MTGLGFVLFQIPCPSIHSMQQKGPREDGCPGRQELGGLKGVQAISGRIFHHQKKQPMLIGSLLITSRHFPETDYRREQIVCADASDEMCVGSVGGWSRVMASPGALSQPPPPYSPLWSRDT